MTDQIQHCQRALSGALEMIESASPADLAKPTPCKEWDVRGLIDHMIDIVRGFGSAFSGGPPPPTATGQGNENPAAAYRQAVDTFMEAVRKQGALDQTIKLPTGDMPGNQAINIVIGDQSIHTWDLAKALGKPYTMDEGLATGILAMMHQMLTPERRAAGTGFSAEVPCPENAPVQDRLVAFAGRQP